MSVKLQQKINMIGPWLRRRFGDKVVKVGLDLNLGCPRQANGARCLYCSPTAAGQGREYLSLSGQLALSNAPRKKPVIKLAYFQAHTSTNAPAKELAPLFYQAAAHPGIAGIIISTRPDSLSDDHWQLLANLRDEGKLHWLELGLQSAHDKTLRLIERGHDTACFSRAAERAAGLNIPLVAHVILGLPGEDISHTSRTARFLTDLGIWGVKLHSMMILENTKLAQMWRAGQFTPWDMDTWIRATADFISRLSPEITIHRLSADAGHNEICLAPEWIKEKNQALRLLRDYMEKHDIKQGSSLLDVTP